MKHLRTAASQSKPHFRVLGTGMGGAEGSLGEQRGQPRKTRAGACQTACDGDGMQKAVGCLSLGRVRGGMSGRGGTGSGRGRSVSQIRVCRIHGCTRYHGWPKKESKYTSAQDRSCRWWFAARDTRPGRPRRPPQTNATPRACCVRRPVSAMGRGGRWGWL